LAVFSVEKILPECPETLPGGLVGPSAFGLLAGSTRIEQMKKQIANLFARRFSVRDISRTSSRKFDEGVVVVNDFRSEVNY
jgi:hypothetical protein